MERASTLTHKSLHLKAIINRGLEAFSVYKIDNYMLYTPQNTLLMILRVDLVLALWWNSA